MRDKDLYSRILGVQKPWFVESVDLDLKGQEVLVVVGYFRESDCKCGVCGKKGVRYGTERRRWRHLDTCQLKTIIEAEVPRVKCEEHGVGQIGVPWAEKHSRFTALFEALVIDWLKEANISAVAERLRLSWREVDGIQQRAVDRGLARREAQKPKRLGIDETAYQKRHEYVTVLSDLSKGVVIDVLDDRKQVTLERGLRELGQDVLDGIECVAMDMWQPYIAGVKSCVSSAEEKIAYDKFHVIKHLGDAVDQVRRQENKALQKEGIDSLKSTKYLWLRGKERLEYDEKTTLNTIFNTAVKTTRAWHIKELARQLWSYSTHGWARRGWKRWYDRAIRSRLEPVKKKARMILNHLEGIINAVVFNITNAHAESINSVIQKLKQRACGFRNRERFRKVILFHLGGLDLHPTGAG